MATGVGLLNFLENIGFISWSVHKIFPCATRFLQLLYAHWAGFILTTFDFETDTVELIVFLLYTQKKMNVAFFSE